MARVNAKYAGRAKTLFEARDHSTGQVTQSCVFTGEIYVARRYPILIRVYPRCINVEVADEENAAAD